MKLIKRKLRSKRGASMILALVFMLFCSFVGGSVLTSATANAYRVKQMSEQQDFLTERSIAIVLSDQLQLEDNQQLRLNVIDTIKTTQEVTVEPTGAVIPTGTAPRVERIVTFQISKYNLAQLSKMQQLMIEATVWRYIEANPTTNSSITDGTSYVMKDFTTGPDTSTFLYQWDGGSHPIAGELVLQGNAMVGSSNVSLLNSVKAYFNSGDDTELYDFVIDFDDPNNENDDAFSQLNLTMDAYSGTTNPIEVVSPASEDTEGIFDPNGYIQVTTKSTQTIISWEDPRIEKGGA